MSENNFKDRIISFVKKYYEHSYLTFKEYEKVFIETGYLRDYELVNNSLRNLSKSNDQNDQYILLFKELLKRMPSVSSEIRSLYRGLRLSKEDFNKLFRSKEIFEDNAFLSTTFEEGIADHFSRANYVKEKPESIILEIQQYKNAKPIWNIVGEKKYTDGRECIFLPNTKFKIVNIEPKEYNKDFIPYARSKYYWYIKLEEI